ncbi:hypothetical protein [Calothrix sp. UHCC 0171]|uniref:hypothetical protein n=1 Tax=Calothrix sp. UHCC 0171 TaxID=3110245 RepID=UPI002B2086C0|nr:hypothetical protein [Calothrix sp. UHCC 0171]MEA5572124.1 hypothetical protein [Calothrix sp. UHCC 0171]
MQASRLLFPKGRQEGRGLQNWKVMATQRKKSQILQYRIIAILKKEATDLGGSDVERV